jgi:hypothetical protein
LAKEFIIMATEVIFSATADIEITSSGSVTMPEGNWKVIGATGFLKVAAGVLATAKVTKNGADLCGSFVKGDGSPVANLDPAGTVLTWEDVQSLAQEPLVAGDVIAVPTNNCPGVFHITIKRV